VFGHVTTTPENEIIVGGLNGEYWLPGVFEKAGFAIVFVRVGLRAVH
jgi:hypothetical protein